MSLTDLLGTLAGAAALAALARALFKLRPRRAYLAAALALLLADLGLRLLSPAAAPGRASTSVFVHERNPARVEEDDLGWPNRVVVGLVVSLALWLTVRPARSALLVGTGLALAVPGGWLNLIEPLLMGYTTDYLALGDLVLNLGDLGLVAGLPLVLAGVVAGEVREHRRAKREGRAAAA
jgi:hypothetical protein